MKNEGVEPVVNFNKVDTIHLAFDVGQPLGEIQTSLRFDENYLDILVFPNPIIVGKSFVLPTIRFLNFLNSYIKTRSGRFYLDEDYLDIAFSARVPYYLLKTYPNESIEDGITNPIDFYLDVKYLLFKVSKGIIGEDEAIDSIKEIWI